MLPQCTRPMLYSLLSQRERPVSARVRSARPGSAGRGAQTERLATQARELVPTACQSVTERSRTPLNHSCAAAPCPTRRQQVCAALDGQPRRAAHEVGVHVGEAAGRRSRGSSSETEPSSSARELRRAADVAARRQRQRGDRVHAGLLATIGVASRRRSYSARGPPRTPRAAAPGSRRRSAP